MKKFGQIVLVFLLSVGMFTGCGTSYKADESTVFVLKDGKIVSTDVENFDEKTYDKDGLKEYVKNEIDTYNEKNGKIKACESSAFLDDSSYKVVVIRGNTNVKVKGTICYVSTTNTSYVDAQTIAIKEGTSLLAAEKTTEGTESATEAAGTQIEETTGAVSDDDLIDVTEQESEVKFQFDEEDTSTDDATGEFSQVYTYIIYK